LAEQVEAALRRRETTLQLLRRGASFEEYRAEVGDAQARVRAERKKSASLVRSGQQS
jgi:hypothetical protein